MSAKSTLWSLSFLTTIVFLLIAINHLVQVHRSYEPDIDQFTDKKSVAKYLNDYWEKTKFNKALIPLYVPTGIFIDTLRWIDAQSFYISGYVWQIYTEKDKKIVHEGFTMPDAVEVEKHIAYRWHNGSTETIGWFFGGKVNQRFDYRKFPLDHKEVKIRLWHSDFTQKALLVPDLSSYDSTGFHDVYGLSPGIELGGYHILDTFFLYQHSNYDTNLGLPHFSRKAFPELNFNVVFNLIV
jgi:hypothetical protein